MKHRFRSRPSGLPALLLSASETTFPLISGISDMFSCPCSVRYLTRHKGTINSATMFVPIVCRTVGYRCLRREEKPDTPGLQYFPWNMWPCFHLLHITSTTSSSSCSLSLLLLQFLLQLSSYPLPLLFSILHHYQLSPFLQLLLIQFLMFGRVLKVTLSLLQYFIFKLMVMV